MHQSTAATFEDALNEIIVAVKQKDEKPLRIVLFGAPNGNAECVEQRAVIEQVCHNIDSEFAISPY